GLPAAGTSATSNLTVAYADGQLHFALGRPTLNFNHFPLSSEPAAVGRSFVFPGNQSLVATVTNVQGGRVSLRFEVLKYDQNGDDILESSCGREAPPPTSTPVRVPPTNIPQPVPTVRPPQPPTAIPVP